MENEAFVDRVLGGLLFQLEHELRKTNDTRKAEEIVALAVRNWLLDHKGTPFRKGYQWRDLLLPDGSELRMRYKGTDYYARIEGDRLVYGGGHMTPREWCHVVTGTVRNPWRDIWIRRNYREYWMHAWQWRKDNGVVPVQPSHDRRQLCRRSTDACPFL